MKQLLKIALTLLIICSIPFGKGWGWAAYAQNLVPNPSFEDTINFGWTQINTADYFSAHFNSVPNNAFGYQIPASGNVYMRFLSYVSSSSFPNSMREIIGTQLITPLTIGQKYYISLKVNLANSTSPTGPQCATNKIGVLFTNTIYPDTIIFPPNTPFINNFAHVFTDSIITDTANWVTVAGSFIADSVYNYIYIGNFFDNQNTDSLLMNGTVCNAYYYLDDICVSIDSLLCEGITGILETTIKSDFTIYPNPANNYFTINSSLLNENYNIIIYNTLGQQLYEEKNITANDKTINTISLTKGILFIKIKTQNQTINYKLLKK